MDCEYKNICDHGHFLSHQKQPDWADLLAAEWVEQMKSIYNKRGFDGSVSKPIVTKMGKELIKPIDKTFGVGIDYDSPDYAMREILKRNVWQFSVAKNYNDNARLNNLLLRPDGSLRPWSDFKREAGFVVGQSNRYLQTEYDTIVAGAQMSRLWQEIQRDKHIFPYVQLKVVLDGRTSEICSPLHDLIFEVDDPVLEYYFPPNHFNCRTTAIKLRYGKPSDNFKLPKIPEAFQNNVGQTGEIFTKQNTYIENTPDDVLKEADEIAARFEKYQRLKEDQNYYDVEFGDNAGVKATHRDHNFKAKTANFEREARDVIFKNGEEIIMLSEKAAEGVKTPDALVNNKIADIKTVLGQNGILGKNNLINKIRDANNQECEIVILQFPKESLTLYENIDIKKHLQSAKKLMNNETIIVEEVWVMLDNKIEKFNF